jgi:hypothetical protein
MKRLTEAELGAIEERMGVQLPSLYRELLLRHGHGPFGEREVYHPEMVEELYEPFFEDANLLFSPYFPFGCDNHKQEMWVIDSGRGMVAAISHETHPDDWDGEVWMPYAEWVLPDR